jgi:Na+/proline symporter
LAPIDYAIVGAYLVVAVGVGLVFRKKASASTEEFFLGGRTMPWWLVGTSIAATTYAADTPLAVTEMTREHGLWRNWYWWNITIYHVLVVFLFARLWRRANVITENQLLEIRYEGRSAAILRGFKASYSAVVLNLLIMGWVIRAVSSVFSTVLGVDQWTAVVVCLLVAVFYSTLSGYYGVVVTDLLQFFVAIGGSAYLAAVAVGQGGGLAALEERVLAREGSAFLDFVPPPDLSAGWSSDFLGFLVFLGVMWWAHPSSDGGGYVVQRISSCRDENHAVWAILFSSLVTVVRAWPWILVAVASVLLFPDLAGHPLGDTAAYPLVMDQLLGPGFKGLLLTAFLAAFMSTIDTHLNWGASYITIDLYKRFVRGDADERHYVAVAKASMVTLAVGAGLTATVIGSISAAWEFAFLMGCGIGLVLVLRWFWWRINATSEIVALASSTLLAFANLILVQVAPETSVLGVAIRDVPWHLKALIIVPLSTAAWLAATFVTRPVSVPRLAAFCELVSPGGAWGPVPPERRGTRTPVLDRAFAGRWIAGVAFIVGLNLGVGALLLGRPGPAAALVLAGLAGLSWILATGSVARDSPRNQEEVAR